MKGNPNARADVVYAQPAEILPKLEPQRHARLQDDVDATANIGSALHAGAKCRGIAAG